MDKIQFTILHKTIKLTMSNSLDLIFYNLNDNTFFFIKNSFLSLFRNIYHKILMFN